MDFTALQEEMARHRIQKDIFNQVRDQAFEYMDGIDQRSVFPTEEALSGLSELGGDLPQGISDPSRVLDLLHRVGSPATVAQTGGRYFGFVNGNAIPVAQAAKWLADVWDQNPALHVISPVAATLEDVCEKWLRQLFNLPEATVAGFVGGTSTATLCGLAAGREYLLSRRGWDVNGRGLNGAPSLRIILGEEAHATVYKAVALLGLGRCHVETVSCDDQGRMCPEALPALDDNCLLILQAGNVNTGAFDPLDLLCDKARAAGAWVHIDGAFGLWAAGARETAHWVKGMEKADSWSVDAHKTLNVPYDCGIVLCRHPSSLVTAMQATGSYILYGEQRDNMLYTPEMSRRSRCVELWATLAYLGKEGINVLVGGLHHRAQQLAKALEREGFLVLNQVVFNQIVVVLDSPSATRALPDFLQADGRCWCGGAVWKGRPVVRISLCSWATTEEDLRQVVAAFISARDRV